MIRVLWVTDMANPDPRSGGGLRSLRVLEALAARCAVDVISVTRGLQVDDYRRRSGAATVREVAPLTRSRWSTLRLMLRRRWPYAVVESWVPEVADAVEGAAAEGAVVVVEHGWMLGYVPSHGPVVAHLHNVDSELAGLQPVSGARRVERWWNVKTYRRLERALGRRDRCAVTTVSLRDREALGLPATVIPNGADVPPVVPPLPRDGYLLFVGSMGYSANANAVRWWAREVWPGSGLGPLVVVGQAADRELADVAGHPGVDVVGEVDDVGPWLAGAGVVVVPLQEGSGSRLKVVEALAHGRPVVSTTKGAEGTGAVDGVHVLLADDPAAMVQAVRRVREDDALAARLSRDGRRLAESLSWTTLGADFAEVVLRLARD